jgi:hypothetical protein
LVTNSLFFMKGGTLMLNMPVTFLNSVPKSGTHLLKQIMSGVPGMKQQPDEFYEGYPRDLQPHEARFSLLEKGHFVSGHVYYSPQYAAMLKRNNIKPIFLTRDLRDIVVSYTYFIVGPYPYHPLREYMLRLGSRKEQFLALIRGVRTDTIQYPDIGSWYQQFHGWSGDAGVCKLTFEQLTASKAIRREALERLLLFLSEHKMEPQPPRTVLKEMERRVVPSDSFTFRKGVSGEWKHEFDDEVKQSFKQTAGKWLIADGYEKNNDW